MKRNSSPFKWRHFAPDIILLCVRWYCRYQLPYRDVEDINRECIFRQVISPFSARKVGHFSIDVR